MNNKEKLDKIISLKTRLFTLAEIQMYIMGRMQEIEKELKKYE